MYWFGLIVQRGSFEKETDKRLLRQSFALNLGTLYKCIQTDTGRKVSMISFLPVIRKKGLVIDTVSSSLPTKPHRQTDRQTDRQEERDTNTPSAAETSELSLELSVWPSRHSSVVRLTSMMSC